MPAVSLQFNHNDFVNDQFPPASMDKMLEKTFTDEASLVPAAIKKELISTVQMMHDSGSMTCSKVTMKGVYAPWVFVRYKHGPGAAAKKEAKAAAAAAPPEVVAVPEPAPAPAPVPAAAPVDDLDFIDNTLGTKAPSMKKASPVMERRGSRGGGAREPPPAAAPVRRRDSRDYEQTPSRRNRSPDREYSPPRGRTSGGRGGRWSAADMNVREVAKWLRQHDLHQYREAFDYADMDGRALKALCFWSETDMKGFMTYAKEELHMTRPGHALQLAWCLQNEL